MKRYTVTITEPEPVDRLAKITGSVTDSATFSFIAAPNDQDAILQAQVRHLMRYGRPPADNSSYSVQLRADA